MPNSETFSVPPIRDLIHEVICGCDDEPIIVDPFARNCSIGTITNDIDPETDALYHMDALDFLTRVVKTDSADLVLFDPPYSPRQVSEVYRRLGKSVNMETTQASFWTEFASWLTAVGTTIRYALSRSGIRKGKTNYLGRPVNG